MEAAAQSALSAFHPVVAGWFRREIGEPTEIQVRAWPEIAAGRHVLATAPTGSGKTLTAFLWALDRLLTGAWPGGTTRVLYVSPLKALNNDVERNLLAPLAALETAFRDAGESPEPVRVATRSGDTPPGERQRMVRRPPEILITTPESLNILLTSKGGRSMLDGVRSVILDEVHAVAGGKRGTHLITAVDRIVPLAGEFQRIALSATVRPLETVARFVGGFERAGGAGESARYTPRPVEIVRSSAGKRYDLSVVFPEELSGPLAPSPAGGSGRAEVDAVEPLADGWSPGGTPDGTWSALARDFKRRIRANRSTLLFSNSRRTVERITRFLNEDESPELAYSHHGSLSREIRSVVERRLKEGRLKAIAATNSLELGIDVGALDEVILVQTPPTIASAVQRIGRSGHGVGEVSRGRLYPLFGRDFVDAAVVARAVLDGDIEEVRPIEAPLDVLAQVVLSMTATESWPVEELFAEIRASAPYRRLSRRQFDLVLEMLAGRYADSRIRDLEPRLTIDRISGTVRARRSAARLVYLSGGTIPDRGYFHLRLADSMTKLGELDEEFVWERSIGDTFTLGAGSWRIVKVTHNDVLVTPSGKGASLAPFWRAEARSRSFHFSERIGLFLERAERILGGGDGARRLGERLQGEHAMEPSAAAQLVALLERQRAATGAALPHRRHLLVERFFAASGRRTLDEGSEQLVFHTLWGGRVNRPLAMALAAAWEEKTGAPLEIDSDNDAILAAVPRGQSAGELLELVRSDNLEELLRRELESSGFFGARFRENAGRSLLLPRSDLRRRVPLWLVRERAKKLQATIARYQDFPVLVETWRSCLRDEFDLEAAKRLLDEVAAGDVRVSECRTDSPSPFAAGLIWRQTNRLMYEDDTPEPGAGAGLSRDLLREIVFSSRLRPRLPGELVDRFQRKLHRTWPGYAPQSADDLVDWVRERVAIPAGEWTDLLAAIERDGGDPAELSAEIAERVAVVEGARDAADTVIVHRETLPRYLAASGRDPSAVRAVAGEPRGVAEPDAVDDPAEPLAELAAEWLRHYGPIPRRALAAAFGLDEERLRDLLESLTGTETVVVDQFRQGEAEATADEELELCDAENLERLLRLLRAESRPAFAALPIARLPQFLAQHQGVTPRGGEPGALREALERLLGYPAPAALWESDLLPARLDPYYTAWLDAAMQESELLWVGCGRERLTFAFPEDLELLRGDDLAEAAGDLDRLFPDPRARYPFEEMARASGLDTASLTRRLWELAWQGRVTNTTFLAVRRGVLGRFAPVEPGAGRRGTRAPRRGAARRFDRWKASRPWSGAWRRLDVEPADGESLDALDLEEINKDRVRLLLARYGVLFRELLGRELPAFQWSRLFRTLRLLELSGEVLAGRFFDGVPGPQFASPEALRRLRDGLADDAVFWINAYDPASPCGLGLEALRGDAPPRAPSTHLVFHGARLVMISRRNGADLELRVAADHPHLADYFGLFSSLLTRAVDPLKAVDVETINGEPAPASPYARTLVERFAATREPKALRLRRRY